MGSLGDPYITIIARLLAWSVHCHLTKDTITWRSLNWWLQNEQESGGSGSHQPPFPESWDNLLPTVQKTARQQHHLCSWGYSHQPGTELLPTHGPSPSWCGSLLWLNVLFAINWEWRPLFFAISWTCSGHWVTRAHVFVSAGYQATVALTEMKEWTN